MSCINQNLGLLVSWSRGFVFFEDKLRETELTEVVHCEAAVLRIVHLNIQDFLSTTYTRESESYKTSKGVCILGVHVDYRPSWRYHIDKVAASMARYVHALRTLADTVSQGAAFMAYHTYVHSRLRYGIVLWGNSPEVDTILSLEKRSIRGMLRLPFTENCKKYFVEKSVLTIISLYIYESVIFVATNKELFEGQEANTKLESTSHEVYFLQKNARYMLVPIFNRIPQNIRSLPDEEVDEEPYYTLDEFLNNRL